MCAFEANPISLFVETFGTLLNGLTTDDISNVIKVCALLAQTVSAGSCP